MTLAKRMQVAAFAMICLSIAVPCHAAKAHHAKASAAETSKAKAKSSKTAKTRADRDAERKTLAKADKTSKSDKASNSKLAAKASPIDKVARSVAQVFSPGSAQAAREAYYGGDLQRAMALAPQAGEHWIAGLAAYRLGQADQAIPHFEAVAYDGSEDVWLRSAAAFWAARAAGDIGRSDQALAFTKLSAMAPMTFYGMIAQRQLQLAGAHRAARLEAPRAMIVKAAYTPGGDDALGDLLANLSPARAVGYQPSAGGDFPLPNLQPKWGFTIDKALVYAIVRQESRFNPLAMSAAGAVGLMQLMPEAAARAAGDDKLKLDMTPLLDPAFNLRVGQDYLTWLMERGVGYDLLQMVAAYNGGPGTLLKTAKMVGPEADSLMVIESLPARETRNYVEKVVAGYWTYRKMFGEDSPTLDALARGAKTCDLRLDKARG